MYDRPDSQSALQADSKTSYTGKAAEVQEKYRKWRSVREALEPQWFINAAMVRGHHYVDWNGTLNILEVKAAPHHRIRIPINLTLTKYRARFAKFTKNRPKPEIIPATTDHDDKLDARATQKVLDYQYRRAGLEQRYQEAVHWAQIAGKGFWWIRWDDKALGRMPVENSMGRVGQLDHPLGDIAVDSGTPFEVLVPDLGLQWIGDQPELIRVRVQKVSDLKLRYGAKAKNLQGDTTEQDLFHYQRQIAFLSTTANYGMWAAGDRELDLTPDHVRVLEYFKAPCAEAPEGRYCVVAGNEVLREAERLPYGFGEFRNPYPVVEFADTSMPGQFWPSTIVEQISPLQREYNFLRGRLAENIRLHGHGKMLIPLQSRIPHNAWTSEAGEKIYYVAQPGIPPPQAVYPQNIISDLWNNLRLIREEIDEISGMPPAAIGQSGGERSGFQVNLMQEAADSIHAPDIRLHEIAQEDAYRKIRRLIKRGYTEDRLITIAGANGHPEMLVFSGQQVDEHADLIIQVGSALPYTKAARMQTIMDLYNATLFGDVADPEVKQKVLSLLEMGDIESVLELTRRDEDLAKLEIMAINAGEFKKPEPWHKHTVHETVHTDFMKSPAFDRLDDRTKQLHIAHYILHAEFIDPGKAIQLAQRFGLLQDLLPLFGPEVQMLLMQQQQPGMLPGGPPQGGLPPPPGMPPGPGGAPALSPGAPAALPTPA